MDSEHDSASGRAASGHAKGQSIPPRGGLGGGIAALHRGDCLDMLRGLDDCSVDAVVCDPPYGLGKPPDPAYCMRQWLAGEEVEVKGGGFMGREWDAFVPSPEVWRECFRVLKPGGHVVAFAGTRTVDWMGLAMRLGGLEVRDVLHWCYWSGFPKSMDASKAIDRAAGAEREVVGHDPIAARRTPKLDSTALGVFRGQTGDVTLPATPEAAAWEGWGTAVKPAIEPAILARKPLDGTVAETVQKWGTGALHIDACRFAQGDPMWPGPQGEGDTVRPGNQFRGPLYGDGREGFGGGHDLGRFPANLLYVPKPATAERERGCAGLPMHTAGELTGREEDSAGLTPRAGAGRSSSGRRNPHPTVKPVSLLRYLVRLVCRPGGLVVDPFAGSGSCGIAAVLEGMAYLGAEITPEYWPVAEARIAHAVRYPEAWGDTVYGGKADDSNERAAQLGQVALFGGDA